MQKILLSLDRMARKPLIYLGGMYLKTNRLIIILCIFILTSTTAIANDDNVFNGNNTSNVSRVNLSGEVIYVLDHTSDPSEGNWITLESSSERRKIQLPQPITITYSGPRSVKHGEGSVNLSSSNNENYTISYPSTPSYTTLPVYLPGENVSMSFFGDSVLKGNVDVYVFNITSKSADGILKFLSTGDVKNLRSTFNKTKDGNYKNYSAVLGGNGDLSSFDLGSFDPGQYCIVLVQKNDDGSRTALSATAFVVAEYDLIVSAPASIEIGQNLDDISMAFNGTSSNNSSNYTYGAILVNEQVYKANIEANSNGTINSTSVLVNGEHFTDKFDINVSNYKSKLTKNELQNEIQNLIGKGNGTIAVGVGQEKLPLTTFELPEGHYYLFVGAYDPKGKIAGLTQLDLQIALLLSQPVANVTTGSAPLSVQFTDLSKKATGWKWDFGDEASSTEQSPMHTYVTAGIYTVNLTVSNANGTASSSSTITVRVQPATILPVANFSSSVSSGYVPLSVQFADLSKDATGRNWDFGDGASSTEQNPTHTYSAAGVYTVNLTASNANGTNSKLATITVLVQPATILPVADFNSSATRGYVPLSVQFNDNSQKATGWKWDFGDGASSTEQNPMHTYVTAGTYTVNLIVSNANGTNSKLATITALVQPATILPVADFRNNITEGYAPLSVQFTDLSKNATGWEWDFGDGTNSTDQSPTHTYSAIGANTARLTVRNDNGTDLKSTTISVLQRPPESLSNIAIEESLHETVLSGILTSFDFSRGSTPILDIRFSTGQTLGDTLVTVVLLKGQSSLTSGPLSGYVYQYLDLWINNATSVASEDFYNATISFKVNKMWVQNNNINSSSIILNRYHNGVWNALPTILTGQDANYLYFTAQTPGFSPFAITGSKVIPENNFNNVPNASYSIFKSVISPDKSGDCIVNSPGDEIPYRIMVMNEGNVDLTNVKVIDSLVSSSPLPEPTGDDNNDGVLNVGETWRYDVIYTLTSDDVDNGNVNNIATVVCDQLPEKTASVDTPVDKNADLSIYKSITGIDEDGNQKIDNVGDVINYQVAVKNNGNADLHNVHVTDSLIGDLSDPTGDHNDPGILNPGETWIYTVDYTVTQADIDSVGEDVMGLLTNTATVSCDGLDEESSSIDCWILPIHKEPTPGEKPVADFSTSVTSGYAPLAVQFTDKSTGSPTSWSWNFGDGTPDSSEVSPAHTYNTQGTYVAKLTVSNANGSSPKTETINVQQTPSSSGGGSSHSSGGSSGSANVIGSSSGSTNTSTTANVTQPENNTSGLDQNNENKEANVVQTPKPKATSTPVKRSTRTPGFEIMFGIIALLAALLYRRK